MWRRTVRFRTTATTLAIVGTTLIVGAIALLTLANRALLNNVDDQARLRLNDVATVARDGQLPPSLAGEDDGTVAQVLSTDGHVIAQSPIVDGTSALAPFIPPAGRVEVRTIEHSSIGDHGPFRVAATQVDTPSGPAVVYAAATLEPVGDTMTILRTLIGATVPLLILVVGVTTWRLVGRTLEPVEAIRRQVAEISATALDRRVPEPDTADEVHQLARTMNAMLDRLDDAARRQRTFVGDASHELRSPLATIRTKLEVALAHPEDRDWPALAKQWLAEQGRLERLVDDLLLLARLDEPAGAGTALPRPVPVDLDELVLREARDLRSRGRVSVDVSGVSGGRVPGNAQQLRRVIVNLFDNAERHATSTVRCALSHHDRVVELVVADDGRGIAPADRHRVFQRFVRLDEARDRRLGGAGLGLAIVREVVTAHGGTVEVDDAEIGTSIVVRLPAVQ